MMASASEAQVEGPAILLDVDGVLHAFGGLDHFLPSCMRALRAIVEATGASIVLASSWQSSRGAAQVVDEELTRWGIGRVCAHTVPGPARLTSIGVEARAREITLWLRSQSNLGPWIALDDLPLLNVASFAEHAARHVHTDPASGLTSAQVERCIDLLGGHVQGLPQLPPPPTEAELADLSASPFLAARKPAASCMPHDTCPPLLTPGEIRQQKLFAASIDHTVLGGGAFSYFSSPRAKAAKR
jgi:hypothetical protein